MIRVHHYTNQDGAEVCKYCGKARNLDRAHPEYCTGKLPPTEQRIARPARPGQDTPEFYAEFFAKYHDERAGYGGASQEFHMRASSFLRSLEADRDEWRQQHENLLAIYQAEVAERDRVSAALNNALSGESDAVHRAESAEMGCNIAYRREPTQAEGDAHADGADECFVTMGGWTGRRCRACGRWVWGGPTACEGCVRREERDEARDCQQDDVCKLTPGCQRHWEERNRELVAQLRRLNEFVAKYTGNA